MLDRVENIILCYCLWPLPSNGRCLQSHYIAMGVQVYCHFFFSKGCACDVCDWSRLPSLWLSSHSDYSPTVPAAPSLRPLVLSGSLLRWELVQVYHHHPRSRVLLDHLCELLLHMGPPLRIGDCAISPLCCMSFTLLRGKIIWAIFDRPSVDSQWCCSMPFPPTRDFHWAQSLLYMVLWSAMSFHSGRCLVFLQNWPYVLVVQLFSEWLDASWLWLQPL
jgi:hypothetical protein